MSLSQDKIITKKLHHEGVVKKRSNHVLYEIVDETQKLRIKGQKKEISKPKEKEILDNYRYLETKQIKRNDERRKSIVKHERLSRPIGKETPFNKNSFKEYKTKTSFAQKRPKLSNYEERRTYNPKNNYYQKNCKRSSTPQYNYYKKRGKSSDNYHNISFDLKSSLNKNFKETYNLKRNSNPNLRKNMNRRQKYNKQMNQIIEKVSNLSQNKKFQDGYNLNKNQNKNFQEGFNLGKKKNNEGNYNSYLNGNFSEGYNLRQNNENEGSSNLDQNEILLVRYNLGLENEGASNLYQNNNLSERCNFMKNRPKLNLSQNKILHTEYNFKQKQDIKGSSLLYQNNNFSEENQEIEGTSNIYQNDILKTRNNIKLNQLHNFNYDENFLPKRNVYLRLNALVKEKNQLKKKKKEDYNGRKLNVPGYNNFGLNSINEQGFDNIYQSQYYDIYPKTAFDLEQSRFNERNINQNQNLPLYSISNDNIYNSQTERLIYCGCCGKPKRLKKYQRESNLQQVRKSISREIIAEESSKGGYVIKYNNKDYLNQPIPTKIKGNDNLNRSELNYSTSKTNFCPTHGYI